MSKIFYELLKISTKIDIDFIEKIKTLFFNKSLITKRIIPDNSSTIILKCINKYDLYPTINSELIIANAILDNKISSPHLINIYSVVKIMENEYKLKNIHYKQNISPNTKVKILKEEYSYDINGYGILMPVHQTLQHYLEKNYEIKPIILLNNILGILTLCIDIRDKFDFVHSDIKIDNILIDNDIFYLIDWEYIMNMNTFYFSNERPESGNTEMYPFYDATTEQFLIHSIGVLIVRIVGYKYNVTYKNFTENIDIKYILSNIPDEKINLYEQVILNIYSKKYKKIENLRDDINILYNKVNNG